jgi:anti-anti-sigma factor
MHTDWSDSIVVADLADEPALSDGLNALIERVEAEEPGKAPNTIPNMVLNCAQVTYLNSSNIAQLLRLRSRLKEHNRVMRVCSVSDQVWTLILATGLDRVFSFSPDLMTALAGLQLEEAETEGD